MSGWGSVVGGPPPGAARAVRRSWSSPVRVAAPLGAVGGAGDRGAVGELVEVPAGWCGRGRGSARQTGVSSVRLVLPCPPSAWNGFTWWISHQSKGRRQSAKEQVDQSAPRARRWPGVAIRRARPRSRGIDSPPRTRGMIPALQAIRRATPAGTGVPSFMVGPGPSWSWPNRSWRVKVQMTRSWLEVGCSWPSARRQVSTRASARRCSLLRSSTGTGSCSGWSLVVAAEELVADPLEVG